MSSRDQETAAALARAASALDGALIGVGLALCAAGSWSKYLAGSHALRRIQLAPAGSPAEIAGELAGVDGEEGRLVVVRGRVREKGERLVAQGTGEKSVIVKQTQTCLYNEWRGILGWSFDLHALFAKSWKEQRTSTFRAVPFVLAETGNWLSKDCINVNLDGSNHDLPLTTVYHQLHPVQATPYTLFQAVLGNGYPVALLDEEKILPVGKQITAVGICRSQGGSLEIKSCEDLPYFLSDKTKEEIVSDLDLTTKTLFWSGILLGTVSIGILGYAIYRNWGRFQDWRARLKRQRDLQNPNSPSNPNSSPPNPNSPSNPNSGDDEVAEGELCVICLTRRRRAAFVPCGHLVCCPPCGLAVERESGPKCPVCRQSVRASIRIYGS